MSYTRHPSRWKRMTTTLTVDIINGLDIKLYRTVCEVHHSQISSRSSCYEYRRHYDFTFLSHLF
jgi:hypothetical protein